MAAQFSKIFGAEAESGAGAAKPDTDADKQTVSKPASPFDGAASELSQYETYLGAGSSVEGRLVVKGAARLSGTIKGEIKGDGMVAIDEGAVVTADVNVREASIGGRVIGNVNAVSRVTLGSTALIEGDIKTPSLSIAEGAQIMGRIEVKPGAGEDSTRSKSASSSDSSRRLETAGGPSGEDRG